MEYKIKKPLRIFEFWNGAKDTAELLTLEELDTIEEILEDLNQDWTETQINDLFWFDRDFIAEQVGYDSFEELLNERSK